MPTPRVIVCQRSNIDEIEEILLKEDEAIEIWKVINHDLGDKPRGIMRVGRHLHFRMDDVIGEDLKGPTREIVQAAITFFTEIPPTAILISACTAGISRSTAFALINLVMHYGIDKIDECGKELMRIRPIASPNPTICRFADELFEHGEFRPITGMANALTSRFMIE